MPRRADVLVGQTTGLIHYSGGGTSYVVETTGGDLYFLYVDNASDLVFKKSTDGGTTWSNATNIFTGTIVAFAVWYDRWSGIAAGLIHLAYTESGGSDTLYRTINTESSDALSTQTTIFAGTSSAGGGSLSITRARGGNVYCRTTIDAGAEGGFFRLPNANVPNGAWDAARANPEALATQDQMYLAPGFAADNQDIMGIFVDASANGLSRYVHDDSANSWAETAIVADGSFVDAASTTQFPHVALAVDLTNSRLFVVAWNAVDAANADLLAWTVTEGAVTALTDVITNSTDDQGLCAITRNSTTGELFVCYGGVSGGTDTFGTSINLYCKGSNNSGSTWGPETQVTLSAMDIVWMASCPINYVRPPVVGHMRDVTPPTINISVDHSAPRAQVNLGV